MTDRTNVTASGMTVRQAGYWAATLLVSAELVIGGLWDVLRISQVQEVVDRLGYPSYFLVILGTWKLLGALALLAPRCALLKEWAYAGVVFADTGAIASHAAADYGLAEVAFLAPLLLLTCLSWALRPMSRRVARQAGPAEARDAVPTRPAVG
ncbi:DoxX family protein [Streptomyces odontomachi]|uniref:DoxX family protein n=1 Tax=Streptomyces odontomachi TaxID=2944940 RepID=UPI00210D47B6|nr:DoxX family protein [Streptomyces sp. ODS25]